MSVPVLIVAFNRPCLASKVLESLRLVKPERLFFAVDGPRPDRPEDAALVRSVQDLVSQVDWACDTKTLFRDANVGCKVAVCEAISWFYDQVEEGIVLEDDCVPHESFFPFAEELLNRFRDDERVMMISGNNFQRASRRMDYSYYFSRYTHTWGWATWRRAWRLYDHRMAAWPELKDRDWLVPLLGDKAAARYWEEIFEDTYREKNNAWDYRWLFAAWVHGGLSISPTVNLISNVGFGESATNTFESRNPWAALPTQAMSFPIRHPPIVARDDFADSFTQRVVFSSPPLWRRIAGAVSRNLIRRGS